MRLLPVRPDHGGRGIAAEESEADRQGHRRSDDQHLSLWHLSAHSHGGAHGRRNASLREAAVKNNSSKTKLSRRAFVVGTTAAAGGGLALGFHMPTDTAHAETTSEGVEVNAWVVVKPDDTCIIRIARTEMGQGTRTGLAQLVAEELDCDWKKVTTDSITPGQNLSRKRVWGEMGTGGSRGIRTSHDYVRRGGAAARMMLLQAAADQWKVAVEDLTVSDGIISHAASRRTISYGKVAAAAAKVPPPDPNSITLKDPRNW